MNKNLSVKVFSAEDTVFLNFARAEEYFANATAEPSSVQAKIAAARKAVAKSKKTSTRTKKTKPFASSTSSATKSDRINTCPSCCRDFNTMTIQILNFSVQVDTLQISSLQRSTPPHLTDCAIVAAAVGHPPPARVDVLRHEGNPNGVGGH